MFSKQISPILLVFLTCSATISTSSKPFNMTLLHIIPITGNEPRNGQTCKAAAQIVADIVNNRTDILPDYHIEMLFKDDGSGPNAATVVGTFAQNNGEDSTKSFKSPIIVGPNTSTGCRAIGTFLQHLDLVDISTYCAAPVLTNRKRFPNLYLMVSTGRVTAVAAVQFVKFVGQWKRIGLLSNAANVNDYTTAQSILNVATENGIDVPFFDIVLDVTQETIEHLKVHDLRVIAIYTTAPLMFEHLLCEAYKAGMTGARYVFIINMSAYYDPRTGYSSETVYPGCTTSILKEQMQSTIWLGQTTFTEDATYKSDFGQTTSDFETMLDKYMNGTRIADYETRYLCHDVVLRGILSLDAAEKTLQQNYSLSLRNISDFPQIVMKVVNQSVFESDFVGLRIGRTYYDKTGQVGNDVQVVGKWENRSNKVGMTYHYIVKMKLNATSPNFNSYWIETKRPLTWATEDGRPPNDSKTLLTILAHVSHAVFISITVLSTTMMAYQLYCAAGIIHLVHSAVPDLKKHFPLSKTLGLIGCVLLNGSSIAFVSMTGTETLATNDGIWILRITLLVVSLSLLHAILAMRVVAVYLSLEFVQRQNSGAACSAHAKTNMNSYIATWQGCDATIDRANNIPVSLMPLGPPAKPLPYVAHIRSDKWPAIDKTTAMFSGAFAVLNSIYLLIWLLVDPLQCEVEKVSSTSQNEDTLVEVFVTVCNSKNMSAWIFPLVVIHFIVLVISLYLVNLMNAHIDIADACAEFGLIRLGLGNAITLFLAAVFIVLLLHSSINNQEITIAFATLLLSTSTSLSWIGPLLDVRAT